MNRRTHTCGELTSTNISEKVCLNGWVNAVRFHGQVVFVDIRETIETKVACMELYDTESRNFPHPRSSEALRVNARRWGSVVGLEYAEAFELVRSIRS